MYYLHFWLRTTASSVSQTPSICYKGHDSSHYSLYSDASLFFFLYFVFLIIHICYFSPLLNQSKTMKSRVFIHYLFWLPLWIPIIANPFQSNIYLLLQSLSSCFLWILTYLYFLFLPFYDNYSCLDLQLLFTAHTNLVILDRVSGHSGPPIFLFRSRWLLCPHLPKSTSVGHRIESDVSWSCQLL